MAKYLVTGIAGFIGSSIAHELVSRGETVRGLDDFSTGKWANIVDIQNDIDFRQASLLDKPALASACAGIDYVVHQAALPSVPKSVVEPELTHAANVNGTLNLLLAARDAGVKRPALLQHFWPAAGCEFAVFRRAGQVYYPDATGRIANDLRRRRAEPRFHFRCQCRSGQLESLYCPGERSVGPGLQYRHGNKIFPKPDL